METVVKRVLFVNSGMTPYLPDAPIPNYCRALAQGVQESKVEIRSFVPRFGIINERKHQLHEVIRLSGINLVIDDVDRPLVIKVASLPSARMQVYFIDNEDYFYRKAVYEDANGQLFKDNGQRAVFFARGVLETVKKLRWSPDVIHCSGWISHLVPFYLKTAYKDDPIFSSSKVVLSLFDDMPDMAFEDDICRSIFFHGGERSYPEARKCLGQKPSYNTLAKLAVTYSDGIVEASPSVPSELLDFVAGNSKPVLQFADAAVEPSTGCGKYIDFYSSL